VNIINDQSVTDVAELKFVLIIFFSDSKLSKQQFTPK